MLNAILACIGSVAGVGALVNSVLARRTNRDNGKAVAALEEGKLDVSVAALGHTVFMDILTQLRADVADCHRERDDLRSALQANGLIPRPGN